MATRDGNAPVDRVSGAVLELLLSIDLPRAFYTRLLAPDHDRYPAVDAYFREVIDPVVEAAGYRRLEIGTDPAEHGFMNVEIFRQLHFAALAVADVTALRANCLLELGYALARPMRSLVTAEKGTQLPFDQSAIPCCFWDASESASTKTEKFTKFWHTYIDRGALVDA
jgi:hypothetical protein